MFKASTQTAILVAGLITVLGCLAPPTAQAADPAFCAGYTDAALNQVRIALSSPNCMAGARGRAGRRNATSISTGASPSRLPRRPLNAKRAPTSCAVAGLTR